MALREGSVIILEDDEGRYAFQLRDKRLDVAYGDWWGLFGGWMEPDEDPEQAIVREVMEELGLALDIARLKYVKVHRDGDIVAHVFVYPAPSALDAATLREGQRWAFLDLMDMQELPIIPLHKDIVGWYEAHKW